jgi:hypothetical protein
MSWSRSVIDLLSSEFGVEVRIKFGDPDRKWAEVGLRLATPEVKLCRSDGAGGGLELFDEFRLTGRLK